MQGGAALVMLVVGIGGMIWAWPDANRRNLDYFFRGLAVAGFLIIAFG
jgi:hypothetical protein